MTTPVSSSSSLASVLAASDAATSAATTVSNNSSSSDAAAATASAGDQDTFLKLMVAQLKYQNPDSPTDGSQYLAETAQFTQVEKLDDLSTKIDALVQDQLQATATGLLGKTVSYSEGGKTKSGVVSAVTTANGASALTVGSDSVALGDVGEVSQTAAAS